MHDCVRVGGVLFDIAMKEGSPNSAAVTSELHTRGKAPSYEFRVFFRYETSILGRGWTDEQIKRSLAVFNMI